MIKILFILFIFTSSSLYAQDLKNFKAYNPEEDAKAAINKAVKLAKETNKHVLIQVGGNWCIWCMRFDDMVKSDPLLDSIRNANYVVYHLNYSKENKNEALMEKYGFPQRFGFPVFLVLNEKGELIHTQDSWYLEADKTYSPDKTKAFLNNWGKRALDPTVYKQNE